MGRDVPVMPGAAGVALAALLLGGCAWQGPAPLQTYPDMEPSASVLAVDKAAYKLVALRHIQTDREADGRLRITIELENLSDKDLPVQIKTVFRSSEGRLTGDESSWQMIVLNGGATERYDMVSMSADAGQFEVQVKTP